MGDQSTELTGPDLTQGVEYASLKDGGMIAGHANGEAVLLARVGDEFFAIGATCTHYSGPLGDGLVVGETVRCPWHHACFSLRTGEAVRAPALRPVSCWQVERRGDSVVVTGKKGGPGSVPHPEPPAKEPERAAAGSSLPVRLDASSNIVVVGAGAAGDAAADMLRREGYRGAIRLIGADPDAPYDRPNLSKDYLAGNAPEEWLPLRDLSWYAEQDIELVTGKRVASIRRDTREVVIADGPTHTYDRLLLATGATPIRPPIPGADLPHVHCLRTIADCRAILAHEDAKSAVVVGAGFIGMEVAASLKKQGLEVALVAQESQPMIRVFGEALGKRLRAVHEKNGVAFYMEQTVASIHPASVRLSSGTELKADLVVLGVGVKPDTDLARDAGLQVDDGVLVDEYLQTDDPAIYAAGDIAHWPSKRFGRRMRVEHWVVAQRLGQIAAKNMLGARASCDVVPFFWTHQFDLQVAYIGHAHAWDRIDIDGRVQDSDCVLAFRKNGRTLAVASVFRDDEALQAEAALERGDEEALRKLIPA